MNKPTHNNSITHFKYYLRCSVWKLAYKEGLTTINSKGVTNEDISNNTQIDRNMEGEGIK